MYDYYIILYYCICGRSMCVYVPACMRTCMRANVRTHVRMRMHGCEGAHACVRLLAGVRACVRACAYICMYDYYIILLYMRVHCVRTCVRTCMYARACEHYAHVSAGACVYECAYVSARM